ncbi:MAG TPA: L,D-transpeptidase family protein [Syntrophorhabdales bacterium]|nr:L,D-transpeptidase family protein [Syntrophorhabdales bacterium]
MPKKSQDAFLEFLKKKRKEVSRSQKQEERDYRSPIPLTFAERTAKEKSWFSLGGVLIAGMLLLFLLNGLTLVFLLKERSKTAELASVVSHTEKELTSISEEVPRQTIRNTQSSLIETQKKLRLALGETKITGPTTEMVPEKKSITPAATPGEERPPQESSSPAPEKAQTAPAAEKSATAATTPGPPVPVSPDKPEKRVADLSVPAGQLPFPFVFVDSGEQLVLVEKNSRTLFHLRSVEGKLTLAKAYPCIVGKNIKDKAKVGDMATPEGIYFFVEFIPGSKLPKNYGMGAFVLNYPDFLDKKEGKTGDGVWLHGHDPKKRLDEVESTKGCVVMDNDALRELSAAIKLGTTPIVIVDRLAYRSADNQKKMAQDIISFMAAWQKAWETVDMKKFFRFYSHDFKTAEGMDLDTFARRKEQVSKGKKFIQIRLDRKAVLLSQKDQGDMAVVRFRQVYRSSNFNGVSIKSLYLKRVQKGWQIVGESTLPS